MPILDWIGKKQVINHDKEVPFRLLKRVESLSVGESENLIIMLRHRKIEMESNTIHAL